MTEKQLNELGFYLNKNNRVLHPDTEIEFRIVNLKLTTAKHIISLYYDAVIKEGISRGKTQKADEIKKALQIEEFYHSQSNFPL